MAKKAPAHPPSPEGLGPLVSVSEFLSEKMLRRFIPPRLIWWKGGGGCRMTRRPKSPARRHDDGCRTRPGASGGGAPPRVLTPRATPPPGQGV